MDGKMGGLFERVFHGSKALGEKDQSALTTVDSPDSRADS